MHWYFTPQLSLLISNANWVTLVFFLFLLYVVSILSSAIDCSVN